MRLGRFLEVREINEINEVSCKTRSSENSLADAPFNQIEPEREISIDEAMAIIDKHRRPQM
jgi:hypothetical protein|nr:MAG TPA: hypothetical protein [Caudoviricetes sp.]